MVEEAELILLVRKLDEGTLPYTVVNKKVLKELLFAYMEGKKVRPEKIRLQLSEQVASIKKFSNGLNNTLNCTLGSLNDLKGALDRIRELSQPPVGNSKPYYRQKEKW